MKAAVMRDWGAPSVLQIEEVEKPRIAPNEVLVRVVACGVAFHDIVQRNGTMKRGTTLPAVLGYEVAGVVEEVGNAVTTLKVGDRVCNKPWNSCGMCRRCRTGMETACERRRPVHGGYAEFAAMPEEVLVTFPETLSFEQAAVLGGTAAVALNAVRDVGEVRLGDIVLVTGATGGLGLPSVQLCHAAGARVIAVTRSENKRALLEKAGAWEVLVADSGEDYSAKVKALAPKGVDVVIDNVGSKAFKPSFKSLALGGRYVMVGQLDGESISLNPAFVFFARATIRGVGSARRDHLEDTVALTASGVIRPEIAHVLPLASIAEAHAMVEEGRAAGRVVLACSPA